MSAHNIGFGKQLTDYSLLFDNVSDDRPKPIMRRGVLMSMLQQNAVTLPLWVSKPGERYSLTLI